MMDCFINDESLNHTKITNLCNEIQVRTSFRNKSPTLCKHNFQPFQMINK